MLGVLECGLLCRSRKWERNGIMLLSRNRYNGRILAFPVDLTNWGASLMKIRLSVITCSLCLVLASACFSPAQARNDQQANIAFEGDPGAGFIGQPGEYGSSGGAASSSFSTPVLEVSWSRIWLRAVFMRSPVLHLLIFEQSKPRAALSNPTIGDSTIDSGRPE
jgi:hypothetical protein